MTEIELVDGRYFFFDNNYQGEATSHIARMALTDSLRLFGGSCLFLHDPWYQQLGVIGNNPIILTFIVKHMVLSTISAVGCPLASIGLGNPHLPPQSAPITTYQDYPVLTPPGNDQMYAAKLFVPMRHRYRHIDAILVWWNLEAMSVMIAPIQIAIATCHFASDVLFMERNLRHMVAHLTDWRIHARFVWITEARNGPIELIRVSAEESRNIPGASAERLYPYYDIITLTVSEVNYKIGERLSLARGPAAGAGF